MDSGISLWVLESMELFFRMPDVNPAHGVLDFWMVSVTQGTGQNGYLLNNGILVVKCPARLNWLKWIETFADSQKTVV